MSANINQSVAPADAALMRSAIQRVATGPELSKNVSYEESRAVMLAILNGSADPVQAGVYLIGLRMKRETDTELQGVMDALRETTTQVNANVDDVVVISDPYNGFNRTVHASLFAMPVLAACGVSVYSHGVDLVGPKFGVTHHAIMRALGGNPLHSVEEVAKRIADPSIGWGYMDQAVFNPQLHNLNELRNRIVKRPVLSTTEVLLDPIRGQQNTHLVTGYVHKPYRETYAMLARHCDFNSLLLVRGTEGGVIPSFRKDAHIVHYVSGGAERELDIELAPLDLARDYRALDIPDTVKKPSEAEQAMGLKWDIDELAKLGADTGRKALAGEPGPVYDAAVIGAALTLWHMGRETDMQSAVKKAREAISSGAAAERFEAGLA